ncbi:chemotaxis protein CheW [Massilia sp. TS11]|uniref:chemotaxis protein CheW n=1 Tax=Massilia sp. TS11 TaxID=2908003 RepID=UPI001EDB29B9|nr:chemotaxis protein CheW [Massilia sp. TS11]MCG2586185.1 chemotaxis protein CheW [Massilia sp. TS11]
MRALVFLIGGGRYALALSALRRVLPVMALQPLPAAPEGVAGLMNLHGAVVPVLDLERMAGLPPAAPCFDTRILLVDYPGADGRLHLLGLRAAHVLGIEEVDGSAPAGVQAAAFLGPVTHDDSGLIHWIALPQLISPQVQAALFAEAA